MLDGRIVRSNDKEVPYSSKGGQSAGAHALNSATPNSIKRLDRSKSFNVLKLYPIAEINQHPVSAVVFVRTYDGL